MNFKGEMTVGGLVRYKAKKPLRQDIFSEIIRRKAMNNELALSSISRTNSAWDIGFASRKGNVRERNEDYGIAFRHQSHQVLIIGDGLGGPSHGDLASYLAVESACHIILQKLHAKMNSLELQEVCSKALWAAGHELAWMGDKLNVIQTGLRTTLIIIISNDKYAVLTYIGDGAVYHYKSLTDCHSVLKSQKAIPGNLSLLSASLGPTVHGKPRSRLLYRTDSDVIIVMSDGIADRIMTDDRSGYPPDLISNLIRLARIRDGNLQKAAEEAVETLTKEKDEKGYLCDDNISLGFIGNRKSP